MKKYILNSFFAGISFLLVMSSCKKNNLVVDQDPLSVPGYAKFNTYLANDTSVTYNIKSTNAPLKIPVGVTNVSDQDRTINFSYTSNTAVQGTQYDGPASLVIPAGKAMDSLTISGIFAGYPVSTRVDTVFITITGGDVLPSPYKKRFRVIMRKYCDVILTDYSGTYNNSLDIQPPAPNYGPYVTDIDNIVSVTATTATLRVNNFWDVGTFIDNVKLDWTSPSNLKLIIPTQILYVDPTYGPATITDLGTGTFSSCDNTFTFKYKITVAAGSFGNFTTTIAR